MRKIRTADLVIMAFLIALEIVLTRFCSINTPILRIGFGFLPVAMLGIMYGPICAGICYAIGDVLGMLIFPTGAFFPGFTLTALLTGLVYGFFLHNREITWKTCILPCAVVILVINFLLDTFWLTILMGEGFFALLPTRILKCVVMLPVQVILIPLIWNRVFSHIPRIKARKTV